MAQIKNLNNYTPVKGERYFVDTNVWYWFTYVASKEMKVVDVPLPYQMADYSAFIEKALNSEAELYHSALTFSELATSIEIAELKIYKATKQDDTITKKRYRNMQGERKGVMKEIDVAWSTISSLSICADILLNQQSAEDSKALLAITTLDPCDSFYVQLMEIHKIPNIVTDDGDFSSHSGSAVYTANPRLVR